MKHILFALLLGAAPIAHSSSICTGDVNLTHHFAGHPMTSVRKLLLSFSPSLEICEHLLRHGPAEAKVTIDMGGDPLEFDGPINLDGSRTNILKFAEGDSFEFWLTMLPGNRLGFKFQSATDLQSSLPPLLSIESVELDCL